MSSGNEDDSSICWSIRVLNDGSKMLCSTVRARRSHPIGDTRRAQSFRFPWMNGKTKHDTRMFPGREIPRKHAPMWPFDSSMAQRTNFTMMVPDENLRGRSQPVVSLTTDDLIKDVRRETCCCNASECVLGQNKSSSFQGYFPKASPAGFEPAREVPNGFQVHRLNHSAKVTCYAEIENCTII